MPSGTGPVLKGQVYKQTAIEFGAASILAFPNVMVDAAVPTITPGPQLALPCNVKVLALAVNASGATGTINLTVGSGVGAGTVVGTPDNFNISTPSSTFVGLGQIGSPLMTANTSLIPSNNTVLYMALFTNAGQPGVGSPGGPAPISIPYWDMIYPVTRPLVLYYSMPTFTSDISLNVSALVMPVILDPNQPYPYAGMWVPNNTNMGAPSTA